MSERVWGENSIIYNNKKRKKRKEKGERKKSKRGRNEG